LNKSEMRVLRSRPVLSIILPPLAYLAVFLIMRNPTAINSEMFMSPSYIATWYLVSVLIVMFTLYSKKHFVLK
ncbi:MAG: hypothetical protein KDD37_08495, partial [Bdellovibrionales bacterium]|nr:hypothetical protein [Bdellovibrionales bacterium]